MCVSVKAPAPPPMPEPAPVAPPPVTQNTQGSARPAGFRLKQKEETEIMLLLTIGRELGHQI